MFKQQCKQGYKKHLCSSVTIAYFLNKSKLAHIGVHPLLFTLKIITNAICY